MKRMMMGMDGHNYELTDIKAFPQGDLSGWPRYGTLVRDVDSDEEGFVYFAVGIADSFELFYIRELFKRVELIGLDLLFQNKRAFIWTGTAVTRQRANPFSVNRVPDGLNRFAASSIRQGMNDFDSKPFQNSGFAKFFVQKERLGFGVGQPLHFVGTIIAAVIDVKVIADAGIGCVNGESTGSGEVLSNAV